MNMLPGEGRNKILHTIVLTMLIYEYGKGIHLNRTDPPSITSPVYVRDLIDVNRQETMQLLSHITDSRHAKMTSFWDNKHSDLQSGVALSPTEKRITIVFRGSESLVDWITDFRICLKTTSYGGVHTGFYDQLHYDNVCQSMISHVSALHHTYPSFSIYVTGHSLGGALATLYGYELSLLLPNVDIQVITFGSPRVGDIRFQKAFEMREHLSCLRVANSRDPITVLPMFFYSHVGQELVLTENGSSSCSCSCFHGTILSRFNPFDHLCETYYKRFCKSQ